MKKFLESSLFLAGFLFLLLASGCSNGLEQKFEAAPDSGKNYGTLVVGAKSSRAVQVDEISSADVCVLGSDMKTVFAENVQISGGKGSFTIENIPVGKNRVIQVQAKSSGSAGSKIDGICLTAVVDINSGENTLEEINWASSVKGNVYKALIEAGVKTSEFGEAQKKAVESAIPLETHASLVDSKKIAADFSENPERAFDSSDYILTPGKILVSAKNASGYKIWLNDPVSSAEKIEISADKSYSIENVAPGSWTLYIEDNSGKLEKRSVSVASGGACPAGKIGAEETFEGFRVHFYGANWSSYKIYYYNSTTEVVSEWDAMPSMSTEDNGYYYDLTENWVSAGKTMVIFYGGDNSNRYPADREAGVVLPSGVKEAWFNFETKKFETSNPFSTEPVVSITPGGNVSFSGASLSVTVSAKNCTSAKYTTDGSDPKTSSTAVSFVSSKSIAVGDGISIGGSVTVKVWGNDGTLEVSESAVYTKVEKPATPTRLGAYYTSTATSFSIWSPDSSNVTVTVKPVGGTEQTYTCTKGFKVDGDYPDAANIYGVSVPGDLHLAEYQFKIGDTAVRDPYGKMVKYEDIDAKTNVIKSGYEESNCTVTSYAGSSVNIVVDVDRILPSSGSWSVRPTLENRAKSVVYEIHVGDFTSDDSWNGTSRNKGKFDGLVERGTTYINGKATVKTGLDHLVELGVTHVQILPMYDFATKYNETIGEYYNWGYDPVNYNVPEDRYSVTPTDYENRIREVKNMVDILHQNGIRVVMDVVYNHTFAGEMFNNISPSYYTANDLSGCGNSLDVTNEMVSRMIRDSLEYWLETYNLDGFRFDLMGIYSNSAIGNWGKYLNQKYSDRTLLLYGEPYQANNTGSTSYAYASSIPGLEYAGVGGFAHKYRETLKGGSDDGIKGYIFNSTQKDGDGTVWNVQVGLKGSLKSIGSDSEGVWTRYFTKSPYQAVNYLAAHDNLCLYDKIVASGITSSNSVYQQAIVKFGHGIITLSQGVGFIHGGDDFLRTKSGDKWSEFKIDSRTAKENSYMFGQGMNKIDWSLKATYNDVFNYHKDLIQFKKSHDGFWNGSASTSADGMVVYYTVKDSDGKSLTCVLNPGTDMNYSGNGNQIFNKKGIISSGDSDYNSKNCEGTGITVFMQ